MEKGRCHNGRQPQGPRTTRPCATGTGKLEHHRDWQGREGGPKILLLFPTVGLAEPLAGELLVGPYLGYRLGSRGEGCHAGPGSVLEGR